MKQTKKVQKKNFFEVYSPLTATKIMLYGESPEQLNGKVVKLDLTRSLRGKSLELDLKVKVEGEKLNGEPIKVELAGSYIRRMIRKGTDYVEDSFKAECRDYQVIIKPFLITRNKVSRAIRRELRNRAKEFLIGYLKIRGSSEIFTDIMTNKIQKDLSLKLKKIYPLALCEIRIFKIVGAKTVVKEEKKMEEVSAK